jgi:hypothetical protein
VWEADSTAGSSGAILREVPYSLFAVVVHAGSSPLFGHYYSYCRNSGDAGIETGPDSGEGWRKCDDSVVEHVTADEVERALREGGGATPYMLLYSRLGQTRSERMTAPAAGAEARATAGPEAEATVGATAGTTATAVAGSTAAVEAGAEACVEQAPIVGSGAASDGEFVLDRAVHAHVAACNVRYLRGVEAGTALGGGSVAGGTPLPPPPPPRGGGGGGGGSRRYRSNLGFGAGAGGRAVF